MPWFSIDIVDCVSEASPLYIFIFNTSCSTPLSFLPTESCTLSALGSSSSFSTTDQRMVDRITWWQPVPFRVYEFRRGWRFNLEKGLEVFYWFGAPTRTADSVLGSTSVIGKKARVPLGFQQFGTKKGGHKVSRVKVNDMSLTEYF